MSGVYSVSTSEDTARMYVNAPTYSPEDELRFPDPPISPGVNVDVLTRGDPSPKYITRPLAILDEVSQNGLPYNQAVFDGVYEQVLKKKPAGRRGHVSEADKSSAFPPDEAYWVGVCIDSTVYGKPTVFGKAYLVHHQPLKQMVLDREAVGGTISNSLWGDIQWAVYPDGTREPMGIKLETVDFVPEERAALQALGGAFKVTSEMREDVMAVEHDDAAADLELFKKAVASLKPEQVHECLHEAGKSHSAAAMHMKAGGCSECTGAAIREMLSEATVSEMTETRLKEMGDPNELYAKLSEAQRQSIAESYSKEKGMTMKAASEEASVQESVAEMTSVKTRLAEMDATIKSLSESNKALSESSQAQGQIIASYRRQDFERELGKAVDGFFTAKINLPTYVEKLNKLKGTMTKGSLAEMAGMEGGQTEANIETATKLVWENEVKYLAEMLYAAASGPAAITGAAVAASANSYGFDAKTGRYSDDYVREATMRNGALGGRSGGGVK